MVPLLTRFTSFSKPRFHESSVERCPSSMVSVPKHQMTLNSELAAEASQRSIYSRMMNAPPKRGSLDGATSRLPKRCRLFRCRECHKEKSARCHREVARGGLHSVGLDARIALSEIEMRPALSEAPAHSLKAAARLLKHPLHDSRIVVTESQIVIQRRETMRLARLLHFIQL